MLPPRTSEEARRPMLDPTARPDSDPGVPLPRIAIAAFTGWNDAGDASSGVIEHLREQWSAERVATISAEDYSDLQVNRPQLLRDTDGVPRIEWPDTVIELLTPPGGAPVLVLSGPEPSFRWRAYCREVLDVLRARGVSRLLTLGSLLADSPHSRPLPVARWDHSSQPDPDGSSYEGPIGMPTVLGHAAHDAGLEVTSLWGQVPHYVAQTPSPKAVLALVLAIQDCFPTMIPLGDLELEAEAWQRGVDELASSDPEIGDYVRRLEEAQDTVGLPGATGDAIAKEFERFLRRRRED